MLKSVKRIKIMLPCLLGLFGHCNFAVLSCNEHANILAILNMVVNILTAIAATLTTTSCMGVSRWPLF